MDQMILWGDCWHCHEWANASYHLRSSCCYPSQTCFRNAPSLHLHSGMVLSRHGRSRSLRIWLVASGLAHHEIRFMKKLECRHHGHVPNLEPIHPYYSFVLSLSTAGSRDSPRCSIWFTRGSSRETRGVATGPSYHFQPCPGSLGR